MLTTDGVWIFEDSAGFYDKLSGSEMKVLALHVRTLIFTKPREAFPLEKARV